MTAMLYGMIAAGYYHHTGNLWHAAVWPAQLGRVIARAATAIGDKR